MSSDEHVAGPSREGETRKKRKLGNDSVSYCGLSGQEVQNILKQVDEDDLYVSDDEPFADSGSEYIPTSEDESSEDLESSKEDQQENESGAQEEEIENVIMGDVVAEKDLQILWTNKEFVPQLHVFNNDNAGLQNENLNDQSKEVDYFCNLFSEEIVNIIAVETNRYAIQKKAPNWKNVDVPELYIFFSLTMLMPRVKKLDIKEYWTRDILLHTPIFGQQMSRNRYCEIQRYLHFSDNQEAPPDNRLGKVKTVLTMLKEKFQAQFYPFQNIVIDESMILFKGRLSFKQYIKTKKHRFGIKLYVLCDCETGIVLNFTVYVGKETNIHANDRGLGSTGEVVAELLKSYLNKGHSLFTDNFYTSPTLATFLFDNNTNSCGTVRQNRKQMPVLDKKLKRGECDWRSSEHILVLKWKDRRDVVLLTTIHENKMVTLLKKDRVTNENIRKPLCVLEYNRQMGAVDRSDMMISSIDCTRKCLKWYKKLFFHTLDICLLNAHAMYLTQHIQKVPFAKFQLAVVQQLLERFQSTTLRPIHCDIGNKRLTERHFPDLVPRKEGSKNAARRCWVCSHSKKSQKKRRETRYMCKECDVGLCVVPCFKIYHQEAEV